MSEPKFTPALAEKIVNYVRLGNYIESAAGAAGISDRTIRKWRASGKKQRDGHPLKQFSRDLDKAQREAECRDIGLIGQAAKKDWRAAAWRRERMQPALYGQRVKVEVERELGGMLDKLKARLTAGEYERVLQALAVDDAIEADERALTIGEGTALLPLESDQLDAE
jgi:transposase